MKKILIAGGAIVALVVVAVVVLSFFLGGIVTTGVNTLGPKITQTKLTLAGASISPLTGSGTLSGLVVGNPAGWSDNHLCSLGKVHLKVAPFSLLGDRILIEEIAIDAPEFNYETKLIASNVKDLLKNIEESTGGGKKDSPAAAAKDGKPIKIEVRKFTLTHGKVRLGVGGAGATLPMPPVSLADIGTKEGGVTPDQLAFAVMKSVTSSIIAATASALGDIGKTGGASAAEGVKKAGDALKGLFKGDKK